ncbi:hypothetical protein BGX28_010007 [Mortierella sp. GBA30]|nr:hypothetical protein BGX28_010007 [Mortierella sp. GBA30]
MLLAAAFRKKHTDKKDEALLPTFDPRLSSDSSFVPLDNGAQPLHDVVQRSGTQASVIDVNNKALQRKQWIMLLISMFFDIVLPIILYYSLKNHMSTLAALLISSAPPAIMVPIKIILYRRVDPIGLLIIFGFILSAVLSVIDGNPRLILLRDSFVTCATGIIFLASLLPITIGKFQFRPLTFGVSAQMMQTAPRIRYLLEGQTIEENRAEFCWKYSHQFRNGMRATTLVWGIALLIEFALRLVFYFSSMTVDQLVLYGNVVLGATLGTAIVFTMIMSRVIRKRTSKEVVGIKEQLQKDHEEWEAAHLLGQQQSSGHVSSGTPV